MAKIKGYVQPKAPERQTPGLAESLLGTAELFNRLQSTKQDVSKTVDAKLFEVDEVIQEAKKLIEEGTQKIDDKIAEFEQVAVRLIKEIKSIPAIKGDPGKDADEEALVRISGHLEGKIPKLDIAQLHNDILTKIQSILPRPVDEKALTNRIIQNLPKNKTSLKIIQEKFEIDPMSVIEKIMAMPKGKFKLKTEHIDGLDQTISALHNQLGRGYLHGGGDTVEAGTNVTITSTGSGKKRISASGGGASLNPQTPSGTVNGVNVTFTVTGTLNALFLNGGFQVPSGVDYTLSGTTITFTNPPPTGSILFAI